MSAENISYDLKRFSGIKRDYTEDDVERLRGSIKIEYSMCKMQSQKLWKLLNTESYVNTLGSLSGMSNGTSEELTTTQELSNNCEFIHPLASTISPSGVSGQRSNSFNTPSLSMSSSQRLLILSSSKSKK